MIYMKNLIVVSLTCVGILLFKEGHIFWGVITISLIWMILEPEFQNYKSDLVWMNEALINEKVLQQRKDSANRYKSVFNGMVHGVIKQGMSLEEIRSILKDTLPSFYLGEAASNKGAKAVFYGYGEGLPTPILTLKFKEGKLIDYQLTPHDNVELRHAFRTKLKD